MTDDDIKQAEARGYAKGYVAGRKRAAKDDEADARKAAQDDRFAMYMAAAMTGLLAGARPWQRANKPDQSANDYAVTAHEIAKAMARRHP